MSDGKQQLKLPLSASERWAWLRAADFGQRLATERNVHDLLDRLAAKAERGFYTPTAAELSRDMRVGVSTVRAAIKTAAALGVLAVVERVDPAAGRVANEYRIDWERLYAYTPAGRARDGEGLDGAATGDGRISSRPAIQRGAGFDRALSKSNGALSKFRGAPSKSGAPLTSPSSCPTTIPPPPLPHPKTPGDVEAIEWRRVGELLKGIGLAAVGAAIAEAQRRGFTPELLAEWVEYWQSKRPAWEARAILWTLRNTPAACAPAAAAWPQPSTAYLAGLAKRDRAAELERVAAADRERDRSEAARVEELRRRHGEELAALDAAQRLELAGRAFGAFVVGRLRRGAIDDAAVERLLLEAIARGRSPPAPRRHVRAIDRDGRMVLQLSTTKGQRYEHSNREANQDK